jgi:hypothetical protein
VHKAVAGKYLAGNNGTGQSYGWLSPGEAESRQTVEALAWVPYVRITTGRQPHVGRARLADRPQAVAACGEVLGDRGGDFEQAAAGRGCQIR